MPKSITFFSRGKTPIYVNYVIAHNNLPRPGSDMAGLVVGANTAAISTGHDTSMTVDEIDVPTDDGLGRIDDLLG